MADVAPPAAGAAAPSTPPLPSNAPLTPPNEKNKPGPRRRSKGPQKEQNKGRKRAQREDGQDEESGNGESSSADDESPGSNEEGRVRCACGDHVDSGKLMMCCEKCEVWQHGACFGIQDDHTVPDKWYCEMCVPPRFVCGCGVSVIDTRGTMARCAVCGSWQHMACLLSDDGGGGGWRDTRHNVNAASPCGPIAVTDAALKSSKKPPIPAQLRLQRHYRCARCRPNQFPTPFGLTNEQAHSGAHSSKQATTYKMKKLAKFSFVTSSLSLRDALERDFVTIFEGNKTSPAFPVLSERRVAALQEALAGKNSEFGEVFGSFSDISTSQLPLANLPENTPEAREQFEKMIRLVEQDPSARFVFRQFPEMMPLIRTIHANVVVAALLAKYAVFFCDVHNNCGAMSIGGETLPIAPTIAQREGSPDLGEVLKGLSILTGRPISVSGKRKAGSQESADDARVGLKSGLIRAFQLMESPPDLPAPASDGMEGTVTSVAGVFINTQTNSRDPFVNFAGGDADQANGILHFPDSEAVEGPPPKHARKHARTCVDFSVECCSTNSCWCVRNMRECVYVADRKSGVQRCVACMCSQSSAYDHASCPNTGLVERASESQATLGLKATADAIITGVPIVSAAVVCELAGRAVWVSGDTTGFGSGIDCSLISPFDSCKVYGDVPHPASHKQARADYCCVDMREGGTIARNMRRSCRSNCSVRRVFARVTDDSDEAFVPKFIVVANRDIAAGESLTLPHSAGWQQSVLPLHCVCGGVVEQAAGNGDQICAVASWFEQRKIIAAQFRRELEDTDIPSIMGAVPPAKVPRTKSSPTSAPAEGSMGPGRPKNDPLLVPPERPRAAGASVASDRGAREVSLLEQSASAVQLTSPNSTAPKMSREERKIAMLMRSFEKLEERERRTSGVTPSSNSTAPSSSSGVPKRPKTNGSGLTKPSSPRPASSSKPKGQTKSRGGSKAKGDSSSDSLPRVSSTGSLQQATLSTPLRQDSRGRPSNLPARSGLASSNGSSGITSTNQLNLMSDGLNPFQPLIGALRQFESQQVGNARKNGDDIDVTGVSSDSDAEFSTQAEALRAVFSPTNFKKAIVGDYRTKKRGGVSFKRIALRHWPGAGSSDVKVEPAGSLVSVSADILPKHQPELDTDTPNDAAPQVTASALATGVDLAHSHPTATFDGIPIKPQMDSDGDTAMVDS